MQSSTIQPSCVTDRRACGKLKHLMPTGRDQKRLKMKTEMKTGDLEDDEDDEHGDGRTFKVLNNLLASTCAIDSSYSDLDKADDILQVMIQSLTLL